MKVVTTKGFATTRSTRHATERAEIEVPISTDPYASVRNSSGVRNDRRETIASWPETNSWRLSATLDVRGVTAMQPELYFYEQWLRERHADIQAAVRAARLRPQQDCAARGVDPNPVKEVQVGSIEEPDAVPVWKDIGSSFLKLRDFLWRTRLPS